MSRWIRGKWERRVVRRLAYGKLCLMMPYGKTESFILLSISCLAFAGRRSDCLKSRQASVPCSLSQRLTAEPAFLEDLLMKILRTSRLSDRNGVLCLHGGKLCCGSFVLF